MAPFDWSLTPQEERLRKSLHLSVKAGLMSIGDMWLIMEEADVEPNGMSTEEWEELYGDAA